MSIFGTNRHNTADKVAARAGVVVQVRAHTSETADENIHEAAIRQAREALIPVIDSLDEQLRGTILPWRQDEDDEPVPAARAQIERVKLAQREAEQDLRDLEGEWMDRKTITDDRAKEIAHEIVGIMVNLSKLDLLEQTLEHFLSPLGK
jgi:hypothetical protein